MKQLYAPTEDFIKGEQAILQADASNGSSVTLNIGSNEGFAVNDFIVVGFEGQDGCELTKITGLTGNTSVVVNTLKLAHKSNEPVIKYRYDKRKFYGATSSSGSFTELTSEGSPKLISVDDPLGTILEYTDSVYTYFKATYYNSQDAIETQLSDSEPTLGDESGRYCSLYSIRKHAGLTKNPRISDGRIEEKRKQAESEINSILFGLYDLPLTEIPPLIQRVCILLAAGYIDYEEYGTEGDGVKWLGEARGILKAIKDGKQRLLDSSSDELVRVTRAQQLEGYPNTTSDGTTNTPEQSFSRTMKF
jgi:phage gp36-like protein